MGRHADIDNQFKVVAFTNPETKEVYLITAFSIKIAKTIVRRHIETRQRMKKSFRLKFYKDAVLHGLDYFNITILDTAATAKEIADKKMQWFEHFKDRGLNYNQIGGVNKVFTSNRDTIKVFSVRSQVTDNETLLIAVSKPRVIAVLKKHLKRTDVHDVNSDLYNELRMYSIEKFDIEQVFESTSNDDVNVFMTETANRIAAEGRQFAYRGVKYKKTHPHCVIEISSDYTDYIYVMISTNMLRANQIVRARIARLKRGEIQISTPLDRVLVKHGFDVAQVKLVADFENVEDARQHKRDLVSKYKRRNKMSK